MTRHTLPTTAVLILSAVLAISCDRNSDQTSTAAPSTDTPAAAPQSVSTPMPGADQPADQGETLTWTLPKGWKENPEPKPMRIATLLSEDNVEVSVTGFAGTVGGTLANVNRWRGQLNLPAITEADLPRQTTTVPTAAGDATLVDLTNPKPASPEEARLIAAIIPAPTKTFFLKMGPGPSDRLEKTKPAFLQLLKSVKISH